MSQKTAEPRKGRPWWILALVAGIFFLVGVILVGTKITFPWVSAAPAATTARKATPVATSTPTATPTRALVVATSSAFASDAPASKATKVPPSVETPTGASSKEGIAPANTAQTGSSWQVTWFDGGGFDRGDGTTFRSDLAKIEMRPLAPHLWPTFPDSPNPLVPEFRVINGSEVPDGVENANAESNFCQQLAGEECRIPVAARHYLYFSGDYNQPGVGTCEEGDSGYGCLLVIVNVGDVTADFTGLYRQGFRIHARYWNGDALGMAMWGLTSQGVNVMTNQDSTLNPNNITNAGANCSVPEGCRGVQVRVHYTSGNEPLVQFQSQWP